jgi:hypothetical protein
MTEQTMNFFGTAIIFVCFALATAVISARAGQVYDRNGMGESNQLTTASSAPGW